MIMVLDLVMDMVVFVTMNMGVGVLMVSSMGVATSVIRGVAERKYFTTDRKTYLSQFLRWRDIIVRTGSTFLPKLFDDLPNQFNIVEEVFDTCVGENVYAWIYVYESDHGAEECNHLETCLFPDLRAAIVMIQTHETLLKAMRR